MEKLKSLSLLLVFFFSVQAAAVAQTDRAANKFKKYINSVVKKVEAAERPERKREIMNNAFTDMIAAFEKVEGLKSLSASDKAAIAKLKTNITDKKSELNGLNGFDKVRNSELNNFANYVQQDMEQADEYVTVSVSLLVLVGILLLLL